MADTRRWLRAMALCCCMAVVAAQDLQPNSTGTQPPLQGDLQPNSTGTQPPLQGDLQPNSTGTQPPLQGDLQPNSTDTQPPLQGDLQPNSTGTQPPLQGDLQPNSTGTQPPLQGDLQPNSTGTQPPLLGDLPPNSTDTQGITITGDRPQPTESPPESEEARSEESTTANIPSERGNSSQTEEEEDAATSKSVKITVTKVTGKERRVETEVAASVLGPAGLAEEALHGTSVDGSQGPRVPRQDGGRRRRPSSSAFGSKDDRRVVLQGDGSLRSREAARREDSAGYSQEGEPANEITPSPAPKRRKSGSRKRKVRKGSKRAGQPTAEPSSSSIAPTPQPVRQYPDFPSSTQDTTAVSKDADRSPLQPERRVARQEGEEDEALQTASDEVRAANQPRVPAVDFQQVDVNPDGSFRFAYNTNDQGQHYRVEQANSENVLAGRYGYRDANGRPSQTVYTAGPRGFRARGTDIARKMDLSQSGGNAPRPPPDGRYSPEYDNYFDPLEDPSYSFTVRTPTYVRKEDADSSGDVTGSYSYIDDAGERHVVNYEAGAEKGFNVLSAFPDNVPSPGFHVGPGSPPRGRTSILQNRDGSYRFVAAGPDSRREEVSDQVNNRRGSYSYIDDKGVQRTVEYIAGPGIGYRIINKQKGVVIPPTYATSFPPFSTSGIPVFTTPTVPTFTTSGFPSSSFSPFPTPFPTTFPTVFPSFPTVSSSPFPSTTRPSKPGGFSVTTPSRPSNQYIPPRPSTSATPSIPPQFSGDVDDIFSELFPVESGHPFQPTSGGGRPVTIQPTKKPKPSVSIDSDGGFPTFRPPSSTFPSFPSSSKPTAPSSSSGFDDNNIGIFGNGVDLSSTARPSPRPKPPKRPRPTQTYRPTSTSSSTSSNDGLLDLFPTTGPSLPPSPRPSKRPRPRPRPTPQPASEDDDDFESLFNPTPIDTNPSEVPPSPGYDYNRPKKPFRRPGSGSSTGGYVYPTTIRPGRLPTRRPSGGGSSAGGGDFLTDTGDDDEGFWSGRPQSGADQRPGYGNCCPGGSRVRPAQPGGPFPLPPGMVIRAHVQSVDLMPYEPHRAEDPGEALERYIRNHERQQRLQRHSREDEGASTSVETNSAEGLART